MRRKVALIYALDIGLIVCSFLFFIWLKPASLRIYLPLYIEPFLIFLFSWLLVSISGKKFSLKGRSSYSDFMVPVVVSECITVGLVCIQIVVFDYYTFSRLIVFGTIILSFSLETIFFSFYYYYRRLNRSTDNFESVMLYLKQLEMPATSASATARTKADYTDDFPAYNLIHYKEFLLKNTSEQVYHYLCENIDELKDRTLVLSTTSRFVVEMSPDKHSDVIINLQPINDIKRVNKFFESVNTKLALGGLFIGSVVTNEMRKEKIFSQKYGWLNYFIFFSHFIFKRIIPKIHGLRKIYFLLTNGYDRAVSQAEATGRLYCCGFELLEKQELSGKLYFVARKITEPIFDMNPTYALLISLKRIGKNGKIIYIYKFRTMHPYAEYIQQYVFSQNQLQEGGKFKNDFRISTAGRFMRKFWIDELPMLFNLLIGDVKLVGVRPLSTHYFSLYSKELQERRIKYRPGLIPPFYADMPVTLDEIMASEMKYLAAYEKHPIRTDWNYFWKAMNNIIIKKKRSN